jgi:L-alanine-DL-glutamate epimerase-like enolase superfamily enzyme
VATRADRGSDRNLAPPRRDRPNASTPETPTTVSRVPAIEPHSNMVVLVDTNAGITGIGQGGSPDLVRNVSRSVIGKNAFHMGVIWQAALMDGFYSPGNERLHALGVIDRSR